MSNRFLIVEDEATLARTLGRHFSRHRPVHIVHTLADAREALSESDAWTGVVLDLMLPDGYGLDFLAELREKHGAIPVLVLTGEFNREVVNQVQALRAEYVCKPANAENLLHFIEHATANERVGDAAIGQRIDHLARQINLTRREIDLLSLAVHGHSRRELAKQLGVAENTVKAQVRSLLKKSGARSLATLAQSVLKGDAAPAAATERNTL